MIAGLGNTINFLNDEINLLEEIEGVESPLIKTLRATRDYLILANLQGDKDADQDQAAN